MQNTCLGPAAPRLRVKLLTKSKPGADGAGWLSRFPGHRPVWGNCEFIFDRHCRHYDWLVVYNDMPSVRGERHTLWEEELACARANTLFITYEPSSIKIYGRRFLRQFGWVLTSQEPWVIQHPGAIFAQPGFIWYYATGQPRGSWDTISSQVPQAKTRELSAICSNKKQRNTLHRHRYDFVIKLKQQMPELDLFGRGIRFIADKADALDAYKYHLAIENFLGPHHWTEKLADAFLGACLPIYYGCPNAEDYFPSESFLRLDTLNADAATATIRQAMRDRLYEKRQTAILESRRRVIHEYGPVAQIANIVTSRHQIITAAPQSGETILSRHALRRRTFSNFMDFQIERFAIAWQRRQQVSLPAAPPDRTSAKSTSSSGIMPWTGSLPPETQQIGAPASNPALQ
jgi:hypothetical protein